MKIGGKGTPKYGLRRPIIEEDGIAYYQCGKCKEFFPYSGFYKLSTTILGITADCKECCKERSKQNKKNRKQTERHPNQ